MLDEVGELVYTCSGELVEQLPYFRFISILGRWRPLVGGGQETERVAKGRPEPCFLDEKGEYQR